MWAECFWVRYGNCWNIVRRVTYLTLRLSLMRTFWSEEINVCDKFPRNTNSMGTNKFYLNWECSSKTVQMPFIVYLEWIFMIIFVFREEFRYLRILTVWPVWLKYICVVLDIGCWMYDYIRCSGKVHFRSMLLISIMQTLPNQSFAFTPRWANFIPEASIICLRLPDAR